MLHVERHVLFVFSTQSVDLAEVAEYTLTYVYVYAIHSLHSTLAVAWVLQPSWAMQ